MLWRIAVVVAVIALLGVAAALATPKGRLPLALRGAYRILRKDRGLPVDDAGAKTAVSPFRRMLSFMLVLLAVLVALFA